MQNQKTIALGKTASRQSPVFGPVSSRRLGRSLGVDLVPFKTCTYDCIYCQLGRTTLQTLERKEWVPMDNILDGLKRRLTCRPDFITLTGSGEPSLHSRLGEIIEHIQAMSDVPVAVLTNGSLFWQKEVRNEVALADVVLPSLDAGDALKFEHINRPHPNISFNKLIEGLIAFRSEFSGQYWLEVFLLGGYTAIEADVRRITGWVKRIRPDRVQLNTVARPPAEDFALGVSAAALEGFARLFTPRAEVVAERRVRPCPRTGIPGTESVLSLLRRRPCRTDDVVRGLGLYRLEAVRLLDLLVARGEIEAARHGGEVYFRAHQTALSDRKQTAPRRPKRHNSEKITA